MSLRKRFHVIDGAAAATGKNDCYFTTKQVHLKLLLKWGVASSGSALTVRAGQ